MWKVRQVYTKPTNMTRMVEVLIYPVAVYGCEFWTDGKQDIQKVDVFDLWCWGKNT